MQLQPPLEFRPNNESEQFLPENDDGLNEETEDTDQETVTNSMAPQYLMGQNYNQIQQPNMIANNQPQVVYVPVYSQPNMQQNFPVMNQGNFDQVIL